MRAVPSIQPSGGEADEQPNAVRLGFCFVGGSVAVDFSAFGALVQNHVTLFGIGFYSDGLHLPAAGVGTVSRIDVHVERPEAEGAMVAGGIAQRKHLLAAMGTNKSVVVFGKAFLFHVKLPRIEKYNVLRGRVSSFISFKL